MENKLHSKIFSYFWEMVPSADMDGGSEEKVVGSSLFSLFDDQEDEDEKAGNCDDVSSDIDGGLLICGELFPAARPS